jgi:hypothetical protein
MPRTRPPYPPEFRRQAVAPDPVGHAAQAGRRVRSLDDCGSGELSSEVLRRIVSDTRHRRHARYFSATLDLTDLPLN